MRRWIARFSMSFIAIAVILAWEAHKLPASSSRATIYYCLAIFAVGLGITGLRERHRPH